jgi:3D (Asp-Asp-Asp) domain-containing protein
LYPKNESGGNLAKITAYSCGGIKTEAERKMNCPNGVTATGTVPKAGRTVACGPSYRGKTIEIEGIGTRICEDRGSAIHDGMIDLYVETIDEAHQWGVKRLDYRVK